MDRWPFSLTVYRIVHALLTVATTAQGDARLLERPNFCRVTPLVRTMGWWYSLRDQTPRAVAAHVRPELGRARLPRTALACGLATGEGTARNTLPSALSTLSNLD
jgi:hypothetical protein